jgi:hypothetical protein
VRELKSLSLNVELLKKDKASRPEE